jgi:hypothetical protein
LQACGTDYILDALVQLAVKLIQRGIDHAKIVPKNRSCRRDHIRISFELPNKLKLLELFSGFDAAHMSLSKG